MTIVLSIRLPVILLAFLLAVAPLHLVIIDKTGVAFSVPLAKAASGSGKEGDGGDDDDEDDDEDEGDDDDEGEGDDDDKDDDEEDNSGSSSSGSGSSGSGSSGSGSSGSGSSEDEEGENITGGVGSDEIAKSIPNIHLRYSNGWDEQILDLRYRLTDPKGHLVSDRKATFKDLIRMRATLVSD